MTMFGYRCLGAETRKTVSKLIVAIAHEQSEILSNIVYVVHINSISNSIKRK